MKKVLFVGFAVALCLASCSTDEYVGDENLLTNNGEKAISFASQTPSVTRATTENGDAAKLLGNQFNVYGVKGNGTDYTQVFNDYSVWYKQGTTSTSNVKGWEYVGGSASFTVESNVKRQTTVHGTAQSIKYWDYSSSDYWFYAISAENKSETNPKENYEWRIGEETSKPDNGATGKISKCIVKNVNESNTVFFADAVKVEKANYNGSTSTSEKSVKFTFKRLQSKVRIGFYETVPGYAINEVKFYTKENQKSGTSHEGTLVNLITTAEKTSDKYEKGFFSGSNQTYTISYNETSGVATLSNTTDNLEISSDKIFGTLNYQHTYTNPALSGNFMGEASTSPTWANNDGATLTNGYWTVFPNVDKSASFKIKVDYTLTSIDGSKETIHVKGAEAVVPANYCVWNANTAYTYLFKISDNTNGTTGDNGDPAGLYPITFDACVVDITDQGTTTEVADAYITTYQEGSVVNGTTDNGIKYVINKAITASSTVATADSKWTVFKSATAITEAEAAQKELGTAFTTETTATTVTFTPDAVGYYVIKLIYATDKVAYKVVYVEATSQS